MKNHRNILVDYLTKTTASQFPIPLELKVNCKTLIDEKNTAINVENEELQKRSIIDEVAKLEIELKNLENEKMIYNFKPKIGREIVRLIKADLLEQCMKKCNTRTVTSFSNELSTRYVTTNLKKSFNLELNKLGFKNIKVDAETKGKLGKQVHYLKLAELNSNGIALKHILSEGEHRCIALSTFLAELSLSDHKSAIVFDDPVSSLDHKWRNKIAGRIIEESNQRQVIIFTHDITFLLMLQEHSTRNNSDLEIKSLTRKKKETGIIAENPPWDALLFNKRIKILRNDQQILAAIERKETEEVYKQRVMPLYGKLRETWERFIEEVYLNGTIQRFGRGIHTQRLSKLVDLSAEDYKIVDQNMSKCSTYFCGHDNAGDLIEEMPDAAEFLSDINVLDDFGKSIRKRRGN